MKVGIITYHRAHNYGAVLQCYALQELIRSRGHEVEIIDYRQPFIEKLYNISKYEWLKKNLFHPRNLLRFKDFIKGNELIASNFAEFRNIYLNVSRQFSDTSVPEYDTYIIGSDQMWSLNCVGNKVDNVYFGNFHRKTGSRLIGFSISSNIDSISSIDRDLCGFVNNFTSISFREEIITKLVNEKINGSFITTLDPTLCIDDNLWDKITDNSWAARAKYIVLYHVKFRFASIVHDLMLKQAQRLAKIHNWDIVDLSSGTYTVSEFVSAIKYSQCVVTSSFHASVFSIIFNRPLFSVKLHDGGDGRYIDLLKSMGMDDSLVDLDFDKQFPRVYDHSIIHDRLATLRQPSVEFLFKYIE